MLNGDFKHLGGPSAGGDLPVGQLLLRIIFHGELLQPPGGLRATFHQAAPAEHHGALQIWRPCFVPEGLAAVHREAHLVAGPEGVDLVARPGAMEVDLSVFRVEEKVDGDGIGVSALTVYGQNTPAAV